MSFAENLQYLRKRGGITQEELADYLQVSRQSVSRWETGEAYPETEKLISICDKFGVTLDALVRGDVRKGGATCGESAKAAHGEEAKADVLNEEKAEPYGAKPEGGEKTSVRREETKREKLMQALGNSFGGMIMLSCLIAYLCMGFFAGLWHPGWIVFVGGITLCIIIGSIFGNDGGDDGHKDDDYEPNFKERLFGGFAAASMMAAVTVYLCIGFFCNLWHPGWLVFIAGGALAGIFGGLANFFSDRKS